jgi:hypothetical protein
MRTTVIMGPMAIAGSENLGMRWRSRVGLGVALDLGLSLSLTLASCLVLTWLDGRVGRPWWRCICLLQAR